MFVVILAILLFLLFLIGGIICLIIGLVNLLAFNAITGIVLILVAVFCFSGCRDRWRLARKLYILYRCELERMREELYEGDKPQE